MVTFHALRFTKPECFLASHPLTWQPVALPVQQPEAAGEGRVGEEARAAVGRTRQPRPHQPVIQHLALRLTHITHTGE